MSTLMVMSVRKLNESEAHAVSDISSSSWHSTYREIYSNDYIERWLADHYSEEAVKKEIEKSLHDEKLLFLGAFEDSICVGFIECNISGKGAHLLRLYLKPDKIGQGYGKGLLQNLEKHFKKFMVRECFLEVNRLNLHAISFYKQFGFIITNDSVSSRRQNHIHISLWHFYP